jgi:hypothetical protein
MGSNSAKIENLLLKTADFIIHNYYEFIWCMTILHEDVSVLSLKYDRVDVLSLD